MLTQASRPVSHCCSSLWQCVRVLPSGCTWDSYACHTWLNPLTSSISQPGHNAHQCHRARWTPTNTYERPCNRRSLFSHCWFSSYEGRNSENPSGTQGLPQISSPTAVVTIDRQNGKPRAQFPPLLSLIASPVRHCEAYVRIFQPLHLPNTGLILWYNGATYYHHLLEFYQLHLFSLMFKSLDPSLNEDAGRSFSTMYTFVTICGQYFPLLTFFFVRLACSSTIDYIILVTMTSCVLFFLILSWTDFYCLLTSSPKILFVWK